MELFVEQSIQFIDSRGCPKYSLASGLTALLGSINLLRTSVTPPSQIFSR
ncbi:hypothetical protein LguiA_016933 [Lonicera macranthoides]